jgi:hypothetical protein
MPLLARAFPHAQFVAIIREPQDVIASYTEFHNIGGPAYSIEEAASTWLQAAWMALSMRERLGPRHVMVVDYDEFARPAEFVRPILRFLGEPNCTSCLKPFQKRINSSNVSEEKRKGIEGPLVQDCAAIYAKICSGASWSSIDWTNGLIPNDDDWLEELINRLIHTVS